MAQGDWSISSSVMAGCSLSLGYSHGGRTLTRHTSSSAACCSTSATGFLPSRFNGTISNDIVSRTKFVTSSGNNASWAYTFLKGLNFPFALIGLVTALTMLSDLSSPLSEWTWARSSGSLGCYCCCPWPLTGSLTKFSMAKRGLWERIFGGVWLVRSTKTGRASKGWLKRLTN